MNRDEGIELATAYQSKPTKYLNLFLDWLGITKNSFNYIADQHRNPIFWERTEKWKWKLKINWAEELKSFPVTHGSWTNKKVFSQFVKTPRKKSTDMINRFILIGKGKSTRV